MAKSTRPTIRIHDIATNEVIDREMTEDEYVQYVADKAANAEIQAEAKAKETTKAAILDRIGLTADELKTILG
jgi:hypothetical protein